MSTQSNELASAVFYTHPDRQIKTFYSENIKDWVFRSGVTPSFTEVASLTVLPIPKDFRIGNLLLKSMLLVQLKRTRNNVLAETWLEGVYEYGAGRDDTEAITDLIVTLGEYLLVLNKRKKQLGDSSHKELEALRKLIKRTRTSTSGG